MLDQPETVQPDHTKLSRLYGEHLEILDQRLGRVLESLGLDGLCVFAGSEHFPSRDDMAYPFKIEPWFKAWLPLSNAIGSVLRLMPGQRPQLRHVQPVDYWQAPPSDPQGFWTAHLDIDVVATEAASHYRLVEAGQRFAAIGEPGDARAQFVSINNPKLLAQLDFQRAWKTPYEIECMAGASQIAVRGHLAAKSAFVSGASELELHECFLHATGQRETELPYPAIMAMGQHASILHYQRLEVARQKAPTSFLIDAGAAKFGYASDITRTWSREADEFQALIDTMERLQQQLCTELRPGLDYVALHERAHALLAQVLVEHELVGCTADEALEHGLTRSFLPHGLGHLLGLQVHDAGGQQSDAAGGRRPPPAGHDALRLTRHLEPGFVVTIEPGLYFIPSLLQRLSGPARNRVNWDKVDRLTPYGGIRIEDDVVILQTGSRNLTREAFATRKDD